MIWYAWKIHAEHLAAIALTSGELQKQGGNLSASRAQRQKVE